MTKSMLRGYSPVPVSPVLDMRMGGEDIFAQLEVYKQSLRHQAVLEGEHYGDLESLFPVSEYDALYRIISFEHGSQTFALKAKEGAIHIVWGEYSGGGHISFRVAAQTHDDLVGVATAIRAKIPKRERAQTVLQMAFWYMGPMGPSQSSRDLEAPSWDEIQSNYPETTGSNLDQLMAAQPPDSGGQLILYHGVPGTGKTYAVRALARSWRRWCEPHYILDPEQFFGQASYLYSVGLAGAQCEQKVCASGLGCLPSSAEEITPPVSPWRLLIFEDANEFLTTDAKANLGQSFSRLLNLANGLVGQGLKLLLLLTTNEPIERVHPAVTREGRCMANIHFDTFTPMQANKWVQLRGGESHLPLEGKYTLSELYANVNRTRSINNTDAKLAVGFGR